MSNKYYQKHKKLQKEARKGYQNLCEEEKNNKKMPKKNTTVLLNQKKRPSILSKPSKNVFKGKNHKLVEYKRNYSITHNI